MENSNRLIEEEIVKITPKLADIEHQRWADWQSYMHGKMSYDEKTDPHSGIVTAFYELPADFYERWERQIDTDYSELSEQEQQSDIHQVERYLPILRSSLEKVRQETLKEVEEIKKEYIKEVLLDFHKNRLEGKGYDFFFKLSTDLDELKK